MKKAFVHFANGFEEIESLTVVDVLRRANIPVQMISIENSLDVTGAHGIVVRTDINYNDADYSEAEILILPGGNPGTKNLRAHKGLCDQLMDFHARKQKIAAICAAPMILGNLNILKGKEAVCYPGYEDQLTGAKICFTPAIVSDNIITGRGVGSALNFALELVCILKDQDTANKLARDLLVDTW